MDSGKVKALKVSFIIGLLTVALLSGICIGRDTKKTVVETHYIYDDWGQAIPCEWV